MADIRSKLVTAAAIGAAALGGGAIANAATGTSSRSSSSRSSSSSGTPAAPPSGAAPAVHQGRHTLNGRPEQPLSGDTAAKVRAAALKKVSGTVERVETNVDDSAPYEAHIREPDGTEVTVEVNRDFTVHAVQTMGRP